MLLLTVCLYHTAINDMGYADNVGFLELTATPKQTPTPLTFATIDPTPSATEYWSSATDFLTSVPMICFYVCFVLVLLTGLAIFIWLWRRNKVKSLELAEAEIDDKLQQSLVQNEQEDMVQI